MTQTKEQKKDLRDALAARPSDEVLRNIAASVPPLQRDEEHSFVQQDEPNVDPELAQPDLTGGKPLPVSEDVEDRTVKIKRNDRAKSSYDVDASKLREHDLERMTDDQIKAAGLLKPSAGVSFVSPAQLAPSSDRPRQPGEKAPAAGAGSWPLNESQMPAVMPTDPPVENFDDRDGDVSFAKAAGFREQKGGSLARNGLEIDKKEIAEAAALYARLRQQFPAFTEQQLADEFEVQWLSGRIGAKQSHRAGDELSTNGLTAVGDDRVEEPVLGEARKEASEASPAHETTVPPAAAPEAGLPSANEPAATATDNAKEPTDDQAEADQTAIDQTAEIAKFDHDGDGRVGGSKPKTAGNK